MKKILGLDLGTNSIGWALIERDFDNKEGKILGMGSRIIPMGQELSKFEQGQAQTKNANRRIARGMRKLNKRYKQRRNKLIYVLQQLEMLPKQIKLSEPFENPLKIDKVSILPIGKKQKQYSAIDLLELRVKALNEPISLEELGRIIYLFNQLRGYAGGGNEPEKEDASEEENEKEEKSGKESYVTFGKVLSLSEYKNKELKKYKVSVETEDGELKGDTYLDILKVGESFELLVNITVSKKHGETTVFKLPNKTSWRKKMENLEKELTELSKEKGREIYLSEYFLSILKENKWAKIRNNVVLRSRYQAEFDKIWKTQSENPEGTLYKALQTLSQEKLLEILKFIFPGTKETQEKYRQAGLEKGLFHLIRNQIIYYQRELKDQSNLISDCRFEKDEKAVAKSHPVFQEFKIWEQINKLTINTKTEDGKNRKGEIKYKYVDRPIPSALKEWLFDELQEKKEIGFGTVLNKLKKEYGLRDGIDFLNGMNPKAKLRGDETKLQLKKSLGEHFWNTLGLVDKERQIELWDILYNAKGNEYDLESERTSKVLSFIKKYTTNVENTEQTAIQISKIKFNRSYGALSLKAIEKILPLVRSGKYFSNDISDVLKEKIIKLVNENVSDPFEKAAQEYLESNVEVLAEGGIMNAYATILVYDKHTAKEYGETERIDSYQKIQRLTPGELRNPLVEQLISEALMIVKDIWKQYGKPDEIRLELARELKNNADRRAKIYKSNRANQTANDEVKNLLIELKQEITLANIEKYKLWLSQENLADEFVKQYKDPSKSEVEKMKLWREQGHVSPYTGQPIPLSDLFNRERYDIDHIIPQSRYFDDSFTNKVICEKAINKEKSNRTAMEYFEVGSSIPSVFSKENFIDHVNKRFEGQKRKNLLATKMPEDPVARQMKETQYISVRVKEELNKIVGNENVKTTTGGVTDYLRNQWGLTDKFKELLKSRYEKSQPLLAEMEYAKYLKVLEQKKEYEEKIKKLEEKKDEYIKEKGEDEYDKVLNEYNDKIKEFTAIELTKEQFIQSFNNNFFQKKNNKLVIKGWSKRIDHRHHAIDALVIACTEPAHVKRLNDLNKELQNWLDEHKKDILPDFEGSPSELLDEILNLDESKRKIIFKQIEKFKAIDMPWSGFPENAEQEIQKIIVSQKPKDKLLIQPDKNGQLQIKIRGQLHEGTLYGKSQGVEAYRIPLSKFAGKKFATEKTIEKVTNSYLKEAIKEHLEKDFDNKKEEAFSAEGILALNKKLSEKKRANEWKRKGKKKKVGETAPHTPISSVKVFYRAPEKIKKKKGQEEADEALERLNRKKAYNETLLVKTGDNYLFAVMEKDGNRIFDLITFFEAVQKLREEFNRYSDKKAFSKEQFFKSYFEEKNKAKLLFTLKQGDPVYMSVDGEEVITDPESPLYESFWNDKVARSKNIHFVTKYSGKQIYFINNRIADTIVRGKEFGSQNAYEIIDGRSIKNHCIKLKVDRLGNITKSGNPKIISPNDTNTVSEPAVNYEKKKWTLKSFNSFESMEQDQLAYYASLPPIERLRALKELALNAFGFSQESDMNVSERKIKFEQ
ncbi:MAG: type II CRISPR RNA-guided endonuclease Cas9 [Bacteroidia bacterium]|nr:type II CRISPR RNA-guided endonuclease Cas9 [Bacteroidia bacterium]MCO5252936.1 type II CRISPR RNA-guided endonuclease Cas9 [Bacteroidota bacterium]